MKRSAYSFRILVMSSAKNNLVDVFVLGLIELINLAVLQI